jgi:3-oxoacyl-[acyl-carrier-protein] synthase III
MTHPVRGTMRSLAVAFPSVLRTNAHWREHHPQMVAQAEQHALARLWGTREGSRERAEASLFDKTMAPYVDDPFRGTVERRLRAPGESVLSVELRAAQGALAAASLTADDLDLVLSSSFPGDRFAVGNAAYLADQLRLRAPAWNFESACSSSVVGLHMAASLVRSGDYRRILVVSSTSNSALCVDHDGLSWLTGDGAGAFVVEAAEEGRGILGWKTVNTVLMNDMFVIHSIPDSKGATRLTGSASPKAGAIGRDTAEPYLRQCVGGALEAANVRAEEVDFWVFNTPNAWYADFCALTLGVSSDRYLSVYPEYANMGAALMPATLYQALATGNVRPGALVVLYSIGSTSTASAVVIRLGEVALGPPPPRPETIDGPSMASLL